MANHEPDRLLDDGQIELQKRDWETVGRLFLACIQLYQSDPTDADYIQHRLGPGLANVLNKAFPEFEGGITVSVKPQVKK